MIGLYDVKGVDEQRKQHRPIFTHIFVGRYNVHVLSVSFFLTHPCFLPFDFTKLPCNPISHQPSQKECFYVPG